MLKGQKGATGPTGPSGASDSRLKTIEGPIGNTLNKIKAIRGVVWSANELGQTIGLPANAPMYGLVAQEVEAQFPDLVFPLPEQVPGYDTILGVDYSRLSPVLIEAIKDLDNKITDIENQLGS